MLSIFEVCNVKKSSFFKNSFILTFSNLIIGILRFIFSIILSHKLGPEGIGLYGLIMPIYDLFICLISGGMIAAISKVSAEYFSKKDFKNLNKTIDISMYFDILWGSFVTIIVFITSTLIGKYVLKDVRSITAIKVICPAMLFIAISSILKGYFYGISKVKIPAFIDVFEKTLRIVFLTLIIYIFFLKKIESTVTAAYITLTIGEFVSTFLLYIAYIIHRKKLNYGYRYEGKAQLLFNVLSISFPLCLTGFLTTLLFSFSTVLIPRRLLAAGFTYNNALSLMGKFSGMSLNIIFFPMVIIDSISTILIPDLSQTISSKNYWAVENRINQVLRISLLLGLSTTIICLTIPQNLGYLFYKRNDLGNYISFVCLLAPFLYLSATTSGILNGLGKQGIILRNSLIVALEEILLIFILVRIPSINIYGVGISFIITSITELVLNLNIIKDNYFIDIQKDELIIIILLSILFLFILNIFKSLLTNGIYKYIIIIIVGFSLYPIYNILKQKNK
ncbi:stage V sporulation protein B [Clostridium cochlearium]|uniref:stage V sporulation protein B n=1 Tax=Clostridium cochlearium TaxID=1494 RepID=UPI00241F6702|nr:stage V sporulation protein B [Clostridium cochlearium]